MAASCSGAFPSPCDYRGNAPGGQGRRFGGGQFMVLLNPLIELLKQRAGQS